MNSTLFCPTNSIIFQCRMPSFNLKRMGMPAARSWSRICALPALGARGSTRIRTGTPALCLAISLLEKDVSCMNQKATSMPTVSLSINVQSGVRQSSKAVSQRRSCAEALPPERSSKEKRTARSEVLSLTLEKTGLKSWRVTMAFLYHKQISRRRCAASMRVTGNSWHSSTLRSGSLQK